MARIRRPLTKKISIDTDPYAKKMREAFEAHAQTPEGLWESSRILAGKVFGTFAPAIYALTPKFFEGEKANSMGLPTMAVDKYYRCYINKKFVLDLIALADSVSPTKPCEMCGATDHFPLAYVAGVICHEAQHPVRYHAQRNEEIYGEPKLWNVAADLEINPDLIELFQIMHKKNVGQPRLCLPKGAMMVQDFRTPEVAQYGISFPDYTIAEDYYIRLYKLRELWEEKKEKEKRGQPQQGQSGDPSQNGNSGDPSQNGNSGEGDQQEQEDSEGEGEGEDLLDRLFNNNGQNCGSGAHGEEGEYELGEPGPGNPGISEAEGRQITRKIAENVKREAVKNRGSVPAGQAMWADELLKPPKVDWRAVLRTLVRLALKRSYGFDRRTWRRLGRASASTGYKLLYPSRYRPVPQIAVVLDTSGSMGYGKDSPLYAAWVEVEGICKAMRADVSFVSVDAQAGEIQKIKSFKEAALQGGGGTDMRVGIQAIQDAKDQISVCIVLTDGFTPWPDVAPRNMTLIAALCGSKGNVESAAKDVPDFIRTVIVDDED